MGSDKDFNSCKSLLFVSVLEQIQCEVLYINISYLNGYFSLFLWIKIVSVARLSIFVTVFVQFFPRENLVTLLKAMIHLSSLVDNSHEGSFFRLLIFCSQKDFFAPGRDFLKNLIVPVCEP